MQGFRLRATTVTIHSCAIPTDLSVRIVPHRTSFVLDPDTCGPPIDTVLHNDDQNATWEGTAALPCNGSTVEFSIVYNPATGTVNSGCNGSMSQAWDDDASGWTDTWPALCPVKDSYQDVYNDCMSGCVAQQPCQDIDILFGNTCLNGAQEPGEECDDGNDIDTDSCLSTCEVASCGDGNVQEGVEMCDDGNTTDGDGCSADCTSDESCGNAIVDAGEECDDGDLNIPLATARKDWWVLNDADITLLSRSSCLETCVVAECSDGIDNDSRNGTDSADGACRAGRYGAAEGAYAKGYDYEQCPFCEIEGDGGNGESFVQLPGTWLPSGRALVATVGDACDSSWSGQNCDVGELCSSVEPTENTCVDCDGALWCNRCDARSALLPIDQRYGTDNDITDSECEANYRCAYAGTGEVDGINKDVRRCKNTSADLGECYTYRDCRSNYDANGEWKGEDATTRCLTSYCPSCGPTAGTCCPPGTPNCGSRNTTGGNSKGPVCPLAQQPSPGATGGGSGGGTGGTTGGTGGTSSSSNNSSSSTPSSALPSSSAISSVSAALSSSRSSSRASSVSSAIPGTSSRISSRSSASSTPTTGGTGGTGGVPTTGICCTPSGCVTSTCRATYPTVDSCLANCSFTQSSRASLYFSSVFSLRLSSPPALLSSFSSSSARTVALSSVSPLSSAVYSSGKSSALARSSLPQLSSPSPAFSGSSVRSACINEIDCSGPRCGDGVRQGTEQCDDGNAVGGDGCSPGCSIEPLCPLNPCVSLGAVCAAQGMGCSPLASPPCFICFGGSSSLRVTVVQRSSAMVGAPASSAQPVLANIIRNVALGENVLRAAVACGDGVMGDGEECDDGNTRNFDGCNADCLWERGQCGDGVVQTLLNEQCEPSSHDPSLPFGCNADCQFILSACGNGMPDLGEQCDAGPANSDAPNAACRKDCSLARCGDGIADVLFGETCDDRNRVNGDGCTSECIIERPAPATDEQHIFSLPLPNTVTSAMVTQTVVVPPHSPVGDTGPATVAVMAAGASMGTAYMRRRRRR